MSWRGVVFGSERLRRWITAPFAILYYGDRDRTWRDTRWMGVQTFKLPADLWIYQEIIAELRPDLIVETGTNRGGSAHYLATICDALGHGRVITIDVERFADQPSHPRIEYVVGSSVDPQIVRHVTDAATGSVLVILDSDHTRDHVLAELRAYSPLVTPGSYLIVEDSTINGHPVARDFGPGPMEAILEFLDESPGFAQDRAREKFLHTWNPGGYLRRVDAPEARPSS